MLKLDETDMKLLRLLQRDAGVSTADAARRIGVRQALVARRLERMTARGVIRGWTVDVDARALGYAVSVSLRVTLDKTNNRAFDEFIRAAKDVPEVDAIETFLGRVDVRLNVLARDLDHYQEIYRSRILPLPHILDLEALMLIADIKDSAELPI